VKKSILKTDSRENVGQSGEPEKRKNRKTLFPKCIIEQEKPKYDPKKIIPCPTCDKFI